MEENAILGQKQIPEMLNVALQILCDHLKAMENSWKSGKKKPNELNDTQMESRKTICVIFG